MSAIQNAKDMLFVDTALGQYLSNFGSNYGVPRPSADPNDDDLYRKFIQLLTAQPKTKGIRVVQQMLEILFGTQAFLISINRRPWKIYRIRPNVLTVEIPADLVSASPVNATYLHGLGGKDGYTTSGTDLLVKRPEDFTNAAVPLAGLTVYINGVINTVTGITYSAGLNTISLLTPVSANLTDVVWQVLIPAVLSFPGRYFVQNADHTEAEVNSMPVVMYGPGLIDIFKQYMLQLVKAAGIVLDIEVVAPGYVHPSPIPPPVHLVSIAITP